MVICLEQGADLHVAQLTPLPLSKIQIGFTFLVPAHLGSPGKRGVKRVCVCVCVRERDVNSVKFEKAKYSYVTKDFIGNLLVQLFFLFLFCLACKRRANHCQSATFKCLDY